MGTELSSSWSAPGHRRVAEDLLVSTARQIRALRALPCATYRPTGSGAGTGPCAAPGGLGKGRGVRPVPPQDPDRSKDIQEAQEAARVKVQRPAETQEPEGGSYESDYEESGEEETRVSVEESPEKEASSVDRAEYKGAAPKSTPARPKKRHRERGDSRARFSGQAARGSGTVEKRRSHSRDPIPRRRQQRKRAPRAGRKHKRLYRLEENPNLVIHRTLDRSYFESHNKLGREAFDCFHPSQRHRGNVA